MKTILIATALVLGAASAAFAEDSSSSFGQNVYGPAATQQKFQGRDAALTGAPGAIVRSQTDRASNPYAGGI
jgi:hypothetical protein